MTEANTFDAVVNVTSVDGDTVKFDTSPALTKEQLQNVVMWDGRGRVGRLRHRYRGQGRCGGELHDHQGRCGIAERRGDQQGRRPDDGHLGQLEVKETLVKTTNIDAGAAALAAVGLLGAGLSGCSGSVKVETKSTPPASAADLQKDSATGCPRRG